MSREESSTLFSAIFIFSFQLYIFGILGGQPLPSMLPQQGHHQQWNQISQVRALTSLIWTIDLLYLGNMSRQLIINNAESGFVNRIQKANIAPRLEKKEK